jgi:hypothetical protein
VPDLANLNVEFLNAKTPADKLSISQQYADLLTKRDAEDQILAGLVEANLAHPGSLFGRV